MNEKHPEHERGQALLHVALSLVVVLLIAGLAIDVGHYYVERRRMQNAAAAGALAGARELCLGHLSSSALLVARDYAGPRNGALQVEAVVSGNKVIVTATVPVTSYFARLIGIISANVSAVSKAACGAANTACGIFPLAMDFDTWKSVPCDTEFYVWSSENDPLDPDLCTKCDCDHFLGKDQLGPGERGWLDLPSTDARFPDDCNVENCGEAAIRCYLENDWPGIIEKNQCIPGKPGVSADALHSISTRIGDSFTILLWAPGVCTSENTVGECPGDGYYIVDFGRARIVDVKNSKFDPLPGYKPFDCPNPQKLILVEKICDYDFSECGSTSGDTVPTDGVGTVSLVP